MIKILLCLLLLFSMRAEDCGSPFECYEKALQLLTQEREKFQAIADAMNLKLMTVENKNKALDENNKNLQNQITQLKAENDDLSNRNVHKLVFSLTQPNNFRIGADWSDTYMVVQDGRFNLWNPSKAIFDVYPNRNDHNELNSKIDLVKGSIHLQCSFQSTPGHYTTCPGGTVVSACTCGSACGSWDIQGSTCHCQCNNADWTGANCCHV